MLRITLLVGIGTLLTLSCGRPPGVYAAPEQRSLDLGPDPGGLGPFVLMDAPDSDDYLVKDISPGRDFRRWAFVAPELRFRVKSASHLTLTVDFTVPEVTYKVTGPVTVNYAVNGKKLGTMRCTRAGDFHLEAPVPDGLVRPGETIHVTFDAAPRWISPEDGAQLSFLLRSAGFTQ